jgi:metal-sulfur cluster biosynthetic enzyme
MNENFLEGVARMDAPQPPASEPPAVPIDEVEVWQALSLVIDPEIGLDIVTVGLVYEIECYENAVRVTFTLTTPGCPMEDVITRGIEQAVVAVPGVEHVLPNLVWEPGWHPGMIRDGAW